MTQKKIIIFIIALVAIANANNVLAQQEITDPKLKKLVSELKLLSKEDVMERQNKGIKTRVNTQEVPLYFVDGKKLETKDIMSTASSGIYKYDMYVDKDEKIKVVVVRLMTEEEKAISKRGRTKVKGKLVGNQAISFSAKSIDGKNYSLENLKGKVIVVNFWFTSCTPCVKEMPELNSLIEKYKNNDDVVFLGFALDSEEKIRSFLKKKQFDYTLFAESKDLAKKYSIFSYPTHMIIDKDSNIKFSETGYSFDVGKRLENTIDELLK